MYARTNRRRAISRRSSVNRGHYWWTTFSVAAGTAGPGGAVPIANNLIINNVLADAATVLRNIRIERIVGTMTANTNLAPGALTGSIFTLGLVVANASTSPANFDLTTTNGRTKSWMTIQSFGSTFTAAPTGGNGVPVWERIIDVKTRRLLRADDDALFMVAQVQPAPTTQTWNYSVFLRALCRVP